jgi:hypothetical protein
MSAVLETSAASRDLDAAADQAIAACGGDAREAVKALIVASDFSGGSGRVGRGVDRIYTRPSSVRSKGA